MFTKIDDLIAQNFSAKFGIQPEAYIYATQTPSMLGNMFYLFVSVASFMQKPTIIALKGSDLYLMQVGLMSPKKFKPEKSRVIHQADIKDAKRTKIGMLNNLRLELQNGETLRFSINPRHVNVKDQERGFNAIFSFLNV